MRFCEIGNFPATKQPLDDRLGDRRAAADVHQRIRRDPVQDAERPPHSRELRLPLELVEPEPRSRTCLQHFICRHARKGAEMATDEDGGKVEVVAFWNLLQAVHGSSHCYAGAHGCTLHIVTDWILGLVIFALCCGGEET